MTELVKITESQGQPGVDARELHEFLEVKRDFTSWVKQRIEKYGFKVGEDFIFHEGLSSPDLVSAKARPQKTKEYTISLDMAKELAMVENNDRGKQARRYFIEVEKKAKQMFSQEKKKVRQDSTAKRNLLTDSWKAQGVTKSYHYINLTKEEYKALYGDRDKKKKDMTYKEMLKLMAFESVEAYKLSSGGNLGYYGCKESIHETGLLLKAVNREAIGS